MGLAELRAYRLERRFRPNAGSTRDVHKSVGGRRGPDGTDPRAEGTA